MTDGPPLAPVPEPNYWQRSRAFDVSLRACIPLFALYEVGLLLLLRQRRIAAEVDLKHVLGLDQDPRAWAFANACVLLAFVWVTGREASLRRSPPPSAPSPPSVWGGIVLESFVWASLLLPLSTLSVGLAAFSQPPDPMGPLREIVLAIGAGLYEEILFRLAGLSLCALLLRRVLGLEDAFAIPAAILVSALLFSGYHHWGPGGEPFLEGVFIFRFLAGVLLGLLFVYRGFAVVCWTHVLYDLLVLLPL